MAKTTKSKNKAKKRRRNGRDNRVWDETVCTWAVPIKAAVFIVFFVILAVAYVITLNSRNSLFDEIAKQENRQNDLMDDLQRETTKWQNMKTPQSLERRLLGHGIAMTSPHSGQRIAMSGAATSANNREISAYASNR